MAWRSRRGDLRGGGFITTRPEGKTKTSEAFLGATCGRRGRPSGVLYSRPRSSSCWIAFSDSLTAVVPPHADSNLACFQDFLSCGTGL